MRAAPVRILRRDVPAHGPWPDSVPPALQRIYAARGVGTPAEGELKLARLLPPDALGHLPQAADLLASAIAGGKHIVVVGDFDCDGATGTAVAVRGLRLLGATHVSFQVPHRVTHGYGLSPALVEHLEAFAPDVVLTVDSGIACHAGIAAAKARGWQVLPSPQGFVGTHCDPSSQRIPSSHTSGLVGLVVLTIWLPQTEQAPAPDGQKPPGSTVQVAEQPSRTVRLPSSQTSPVSRMLLPQRVHAPPVGGHTPPGSIWQTGLSRRTIR